MVNVGVCLQRGSTSRILVGESIKDRQSTYNVALKRVRAIIFVEEKQ